VNLDNDCCLETTSDAFRIGSRTERERIIKLLEAEYADTFDTLGIALAQAELDLLIKLIALIKGENK
jgi:hypothetical protein